MWIINYQNEEEAYLKMAVTSWMAAWLWGSLPSFTPCGARRGEPGPCGTPLALQWSPRLGLPPVLCPRGRLFSRSPSISTGVPLSPPGHRRPLTADLPDGRMANQVVGRLCGECSPFWNLPLALGSATSALDTWCQMSLASRPGPPQPLPLLQGSPKAGAFGHVFGIFLRQRLYQGTC